MPDAGGFTVDEPVTRTPVWVESDGWSEGAIPPRPWIARGYLLCGAVSVISGASSVSKSTLAVGYAVSLVLHRPLNRFIPLMPCRVLTYNVENDAAKQRRRFSAVLRQFDVTPSDIAGKVMRVGPNDVGTLIARDPDSRVLVLTAAMVELQRLIVEFKPLVLISTRWWSCTRRKRTTTQHCARS